MTNAPDTRKTHVIRIFGTNKVGDVLHDISADVERTDVAKTVSNDDNYQGVEVRYRWMDDPTSDDYDPDGNPSRDIEIVKVCDPESEDDLNDPEEWIPIPCIKQMKSVTTQGDNNYQGRQGRNKNNNDDGHPNDARIVRRRRIYHYDTNIDDAAQAAADADPSLKAFVVDGKDYERNDDTKDDSQYVEHEIPVYVKERGASSSGATNMPRVDDQGLQVKLLNGYLIDESEPAKLDKVGEGNINPPYRLDPHQYIINVNWSRTVIVVFADLNVDRIPSTFLVIDDNPNVKLLKTFNIHTVNPGITDAVCRAYKVSANKGEFISSVIPNVDPFNGNGIYALVFAIKGDIDTSLDRAVNGTQFAMAGAHNYFLEDGATPIPHDLRTEGLIWFIGLSFLPPGKQINWKIKYLKHRSDDSSSPPNKMVQCYPVTDTPWTVPGGGSFSKYTLICYRLDREGTGDVYGAGNPDFNPPSYPGANSVEITDPPPLMSSDKILP